MAVVYNIINNEANTFVTVLQQRVNTAGTVFPEIYRRNYYAICTFGSYGKPSGCSQKIVRTVWKKRV